MFSTEIIIEFLATSVAFGALCFGVGLLREALQPMFDKLYKKMAAHLLDVRVHGE